MELRVFFFMLSVVSCGMFHSAAPASLGEEAMSATSIPARHIRTKRCSCATFLDKECVYFCHLDIIWVNTPERTVSYGLGNAPRKKRSAKGPSYTSQDTRCKCDASEDHTCMTFCQTENNVRYQAAPDKVILAAEGDGCAEKQCKRKLAAKTGRIKRVKKGVQKGEEPSAVRAARKARLLLEKWRVRQRHRARAWVAENTAS